MVSYRSWSQPVVRRLHYKKVNAIQCVCFFYSGALKRVFTCTFVSPLFIWYTSPLGYMDSAKKEYNCQSRKPSTSVTERMLYLVADFIFLSGAMLASHLTITWSHSHCKTNFSDIGILANRHHLTIKFMAEISNKEVNFLDTTVYKGERFCDQGILDVCTHIKVFMTQKIFSAYLKDLSKYRRMAFFLLKYLISF